MTPDTALSSEHTTPPVKKSRVSLVWLVSEFGQIIFIATLVSIAVMSFGARIPFLSQWGVRFFAVISGSMEPTIPTGALILASKVDMAELKEGDIITYAKGGEQNQAASMVTHRIAQITRSERRATVKNDDGTTTETQPVMQYEIRTKGDANANPDGYTVVPGEIVGRYRWHAPYLGYLVSYIQTAQGFVLFVIVPSFIVIVWESVSLVLSVRAYFESRKNSTSHHSVGK